MAKLLSTKPLPVPQVESIIIEITGEEALALRAVFAQVGGNSDTTRRGLIDSVSRMVGKAINDCYDSTDIEGSIYFK